jgi:hypothetical protein
MVLMGYAEGISKTYQELVVGLDRNSCPTSY